MKVDKKYFCDCPYRNLALVFHYLPQVKRKASGTRYYGLVTV